MRWLCTFIAAALGILFNVAMVVDPKHVDAYTPVLAVGVIWALLAIAWRPS